METAMLITLLVYLSLFNGPVTGNERWKGSWFPYSITDNIDNNPLVSHNDIDEGAHDSSRIPMGTLDECDDCKTNYDTNLSNIYATLCLYNRTNYLPRPDVPPVLTNEHIPTHYEAPHMCQNQSIVYGRKIPTFGPHLPNWAKYGEHTVLPKQRWLHNLEHGAVVMLYHPCADKNEIEYLKKLVTSCLYRHIITTTVDLSPQRPLALVTWGYLLEMSKVSKRIVVDFIKEHALHGPERTYRDGNCNAYLIKHAKVVSNLDDQVLCPYISD